MTRDSLQIRITILQSTIMSNIGNDFLYWFKWACHELGKLRKTIDMHKFPHFCTMKWTVLILYSHYFTAYFEFWCRERWWRIIFEMPWKWNHDSRSLLRCLRKAQARVQMNPTLTARLKTVGHRGFTRKKAHTFIKSCQPSTRIIKQHWIYPTISGSNFMALDRKYGHHRMHTYAEIKLLFFTLEGVRLDPRVAPAPVSRVSSCNTCAWN